MSELELRPGVRRIAVLRANGIGDFLSTLPALDALAATYPGAEITLIGDAWLVDFLVGRPGPWHAVAVAPTYPGLRGLASDAPEGADAAVFLAGQRERRYDIAVQLHGGGYNSNHFVSGLGARLTVGARATGAPALDRTVPYVERRNEVLRCLEVVGLVGAVASGTGMLLPRIAVTSDDLAESRERLPEEEPFAVLHAGARDPRRRWPTASFAGVGRGLLERGLRVVLTGAAADRALSAEVASGLDPGAVTDLTGRLSLGGTLGLVARAALFVGNDSGPRHLAVAAGTPTVGIFWVVNLLTFGPLAGGSHRVAAAYRSSCPVCGREQDGRRCPHDVSFTSDVTVEQVLAQAQAALQA